MCTGRKHVRALQAVYTCHIRTRTVETERVHSRVRAMLARSCTGRVHDRACTPPVYTPVYMAHVHVNRARVHSRVHGRLRTVYTAVCVYGTCTGALNTVVYTVVYT